MSMLPEIERDLVAAALRRREALATRRPSVGGMRHVWHGRRALVLVCGSLLVAVPALAATRPWEPLLGKPSADGRSPAVSRDGIPAAQLQALGVLRRQQTDQDRGATTEQLLGALAPQTDGVRLHGVRLLRAGDHPIALVPVARLYTRQPGLGVQPYASNGLCLTDGQAVMCGDSGELRRAGFTGHSGAFAFGLVPDEVATVRFSFDDGPVVDTAVHDNFYGRTLPEVPAATDDPRTALLLKRDPATSAPAAAAHAVSVTWLDGAGEPVWHSHSPAAWPRSSGS